MQTEHFLDAVFFLSLHCVDHVEIDKIDYAEQEQAKEVLQEEAAMVQWNLIPPLEIRFANLLYRNPTLLDRACEFFDMNLAESGIQLLESSVVDEFVNTAIAHYAETGYFSPQTLYEILPQGKKEHPAVQRRRNPETHGPLRVHAGIAETGRLLQERRHRHQPICRQNYQQQG